MIEGVIITLQEGEHGGRYLATLPGFDGEAQMTFHRSNDHQIIVNHTGVPDAMKGRGVATALVRHAISDARTKGIKIIPHCSFVRAQAIKHPEWEDVIEN